MSKRGQHIHFGRLLGYSLMLVAPTVLALDSLVYLHDIVVDRAIWVVASVMVSTIAIVWLFLAELAGMARFTDKIAAGDKSDLPQLNTQATRGIAKRVAQLDFKWRSQVRAFSQSIDADMQILESLTDPLILVNSSYLVIRANAAARKLFGRELAGESIETALRPPDLLNAVRIGLETRAPQSLEFEWRGHFSRFFDARILPIETSSADADHPADAADTPLPIAAVITLHETTELHRAAETREKFIANVSHELRTPLSVVAGFVETLQDLGSEDPDSQKRFLGIMRDQTTRMTRLVADLLSLSKLDEQDQVPTETVNLADIVTSVSGAMELKAAARSITIERALGDKLYVCGDYDQLCQVVQNLLDNAVNYGKHGGYITVSAQRSDDHIVLSVRDDGEGISPEHIPHLGERFYRVDPSRARTKGGSGLGLAIVQGTLRRHNATLSVKSVPDEGSTFTINFPAVKP